MDYLELGEFGYQMKEYLYLILRKKEISSFKKFQTFYHQLLRTGSLEKKIMKSDNAIFVDSEKLKLHVGLLVYFISSLNVQNTNI